MLFCGFCIGLFSNLSNSDKYTEFAFWNNSWLTFLSLIEDQPPEILDKSSLWLHPLIIPEESNLTCLPEWTTKTDDPQSPPPQQQADSKWNNILSPPQIHTGHRFDLNTMSTDDILSLTSEPIPMKTKGKKLLDTPRGKTPYTPNKPSSSTASNLMSAFRNKIAIDSSIASPVCTPNRSARKLPPLTVANSNTSSRPRRAAAIKADERIQQIHDDDTMDNPKRIHSPRIASASSHGDENHPQSVDLLIDQLDALHIERKLKFDDDEEEESTASPSTKSNEKLLQQCIQLHDRLAYAPNAKLIRYLAEYIILLSGDQDPWLIVTLVVEMQAIGFRYNALCIYQRKKR